MFVIRSKGLSRRDSGEDGALLVHHVSPTADSILLAARATVYRHGWDHGRFSLSSEFQHYLLQQRYQRVTISNTKHITQTSSYNFNKNHVFPVFHLTLMYVNGFECLSTAIFLCNQKLNVNFTVIWHVYYNYFIINACILLYNKVYVHAVLYHLNSKLSNCFFQIPLTSKVSIFPPVTVHIE